MKYNSNSKYRQFIDFMSTGGDGDEHLSDTHLLHKDFQL